MAIFGLFLKSIFLVALLIAVFIVGVIIYMYMRVKQVARQYAAGGARRGTAAGQPNRGAQAHRTDAGAAAGGRQSAREETTADVYEELYDERSPREANRKIFSKDEGEYIDFEEEK